MLSPRSLAVDRVAFLIEEATRAAGFLGAATAYHLANGGGAWRMGLALDCGVALALPWQDAAALAASCELVHQASVVHDDVQDGEAVRRGRPSVAARYGVPAAICVGDQLLTGAFALLADLPCASGLVRLFAAGISEMVAGQAEEFAPTLWPGMTLDRYRFLAGGKAGAAVALPIEGAALLSGMSGCDMAQASQAGRALGMAYQASDDAADLAADLRRGALNGAVAHALDAGSSDRREWLLALLARARREGVSEVEAADCAARLAPQVERLTAWARMLLGGIARDMASHRLGPVLAGSVSKLKSRLDMPVSERSHAA